MGGTHPLKRNPWGSRPFNLGGRGRTSNLLVNGQALCRLSYTQKRTTLGRFATIPRHRDAGDNLSKRKKTRSPQRCSLTQARQPSPYLPSAEISISLSVIPVILPTDLGRFITRV